MLSIKTSVEMKRLSAETRTIFVNMAQDYEREFSPLTNKKPDDDGQFQFTDEKSGIYDVWLGFSGAECVGFAVVDVSHSLFDIAEFYVIPTRRKQHIGEEMAKFCFTHYPGKWQVRQILGAERARDFWVSVIGKVTGQKIETSLIYDQEWGQVYCQKFDTTTVSSIALVQVFRNCWSVLPALILVIYASAAMIWALPDRLFPFRHQVNSVTRHIMIPLALYQTWDMFGPLPRAEDFKVEVEFKNRDGTFGRWAVTNMTKKSYYDRWQKEHWRKYINDAMRLDEHKILWGPFAEYSVKYLKKLGFDPVTLNLVRFSRPAHVPLTPEYRSDRRSDSWDSFIFYRWKESENP